MSQITTHILDISIGKPAANVEVRLYSVDGHTGAMGPELGRGRTNQDGRITDLLDGETILDGGNYQLVFEVAPYYESLNTESFYPQVTIAFKVAASQSGQPAEHYHVPLLLSPFGYSTYRGS